MLLDLICFKSDQWGKVIATCSIDNEPDSTWNVNPFEHGDLWGLSDQREREESKMMCCKLYPIGHTHARAPTKTTTRDGRTTFHSKIASRFRQRTVVKDSPIS